MSETPYVREPGYATRYRDQRFVAAYGPRTDRKERRAIHKLLAQCTPPSGPWLDVPSGAGRLTGELPAASVQADRNPAMLAAAGTVRPRVCASAAALPFATGTFAGVLCMRLLQHLPTPAERIAVLEELRRVSRGPALVSFFDSRTLQHARRLLRRATGKNRSGRSAVSRAQFCREAVQAGWRVAGWAALLPWISEQTVVLLMPSTASPPRH